MNTLEQKAIDNHGCIACSHWDYIETTTHGFCKLDNEVHNCAESFCKSFDCAPIGTIIKRLREVKKRVDKFKNIV